MNYIISYFNRFEIHKQLQSEWKVVFFIGAAIYFVGGVTFNFFAKSDLQSWAFVDCEPANGLDKEEKDLKEAESIRQQIIKAFDHSKFIAKL